MHFFEPFFFVFLQVPTPRPPPVPVFPGRGIRAVLPLGDPARLDPRLRRPRPHVLRDLRQGRRRWIDRRLLSPFRLRQWPTADLIKVL